jgi:hypothetical protein
MKVQKWNVKTRKYEPYEMPVGVILFTHNLDEITSCAQCGKQVVYGDAFTSLEVHNENGLGYPVCDDCYRSENDRKYEPTIQNEPKGSGFATFNESEIDLKDVVEKLLVMMANTNPGYEPECTYLLAEMNKWGKTYAS